MTLSLSYLVRSVPIGHDDGHTPPGLTLTRPGEPAPPDAASDSGLRLTHIHVLLHLQLALWWRKSTVKSLCVKALGNTVVLLSNDVHD